MIGTERPSARAQYEHKLEALQQDVLRMGSVVEQMLHKAIDAYMRRDLPLAHEVIEMDDVVDGYNLDVELNCLQLLALQNPMARDLRVIAASLKVISDIERMGDYCVDIAKMADRMADKPAITPQPMLSEMAERVNVMLRDTLRAFVSRDLDLVHEMVKTDDQVDLLNKRIIHRMIEVIRADVNVTEQAVGVIMVSRYLERIADHVTNVGERVYYVETGEHKELHV